MSTTPERYRWWFVEMYFNCLHSTSTVLHHVLLRRLTRRPHWDSGFFWIASISFLKMWLPLPLALSPSDQRIDGYLTSAPTKFFVQSVCGIVSAEIGVEIAAFPDYEQKSESVSIAVNVSNDIKFDARRSDINNASYIYIYINSMLCLLLHIWRSHQWPVTSNYLDSHSACIFPQI